MRVDFAGAEGAGGSDLEGPHEPVDHYLVDAGARDDIRDDAPGCGSTLILTLVRST
jgi:hypothetical protein